MKQDNQFQTFQAFVLNAMDAMNDKSASIASRLSFALAAGMSPNRILAYIPPEGRDLAKRVLDICMKEQAEFNRQPQHDENKP